MIYVLPFDPIKIFIDWAHRNDHQNLSVMKAINVVDKKWQEMVLKGPFSDIVHFVFDQSLHQSGHCCRLKKSSKFSKI